MKFMASFLVCFTLTRPLNFVENDNFFCETGTCFEGGFFEGAGWIFRVIEKVLWMEKLLSGKFW